MLWTLSKNMIPLPSEMINFFKLKFFRVINRVNFFLFQRQDIFINLPFIYFVRCPKTLDFSETEKYWKKMTRCFLQYKPTPFIIRGKSYTVSRFSSQHAIEQITVWPASEISSLFYRSLRQWWQWTENNKGLASHLYAHHIAIRLAPFLKKIKIC